MAVRNATQCVMQHDQCRQTQYHVYAGQNLYNECSRPQYGVSKVVEGAMKSWNLPARGQVGHFTQMVRNNAFVMGCGIVRSISYNGGTWHCYFIVCNYATTNMISLPVYRAGQMGSKCKIGMNPNYLFLYSFIYLYFIIYIN